MKTSLQIYFKLKIFLRKYAQELKMLMEWKILSAKCLSTGVQSINLLQVTGPSLSAY